METAIATTSHGKSGRVLLANLIAGPLIAGTLMTAPVWAAVLITSTAEKGANSRGMLAVAAGWIVSALFMSLAYLAAGLAAGAYSWFSTRQKGSYSVPLAIAISMATALVLALGAVLNTKAGGAVAPIGVALVGAAASAAAAGWLARRWGASWR
jgi:hypothetical protein